ncbi:MAG: threonine synthase [Clostridia bacterium]|nr:threonine synthase [Clostridia bacterium]
MAYFVSTRNVNAVQDARTAIMNGLSPDGGLYVPETIPATDYHKLIGLSYADMAKQIIRLWFDDFTYDEIAASCEDAYSSHFDTPLVAPVKQAGDVFITELFHGETCAFKDVALSLLPRLVSKARRSLGIADKTLILTATSGDTGSAAMNGFRNVEGTGIITFFPHRGISTVQRRQMVCMTGRNIKACAVDGNFDDCQTGVKNAFATLPRIPLCRYSSANSINIARLVPQITYYFSTYISLISSGCIKDGQRICFAVPTGNFGDILAGYYAKHMGLPIDKLVCASNSNNVLTEFLNAGVYDKRREFLTTYSPSMDILISSNLERLLYHTQNNDTNIVVRQMEQLKAEGRYKTSQDTLKTIKEDFAAYSFDDAATLKMIRTTFDAGAYLADPHTAVALCAQAAFSRDNPGSVCVVLSTASPYKFPACICKALGIRETDDPFREIEQIENISGKPAPDSIKLLEQKTVIHPDVIAKTGINEYILKNMQELI